MHYSYSARASVYGTRSAREMLHRINEEERSVALHQAARTTVFAFFAAEERKKAAVWSIAGKNETRVNRSQPLASSTERMNCGEQAAVVQNENVARLSSATAFPFSCLFPSTLWQKIAAALKGERYLPAVSFLL